MTVCALPDELRSWAGHPGNNVCCASKHAATGFTRGLALELASDDTWTNLPYVTGACHG